MLTLLDVLHEVPTLADLLTKSAQKALSAASRSFRELFIAQVQAVTVTSREDFDLLFKCKWPLLSMVIHESDKRDDPFAPSDRTVAYVTTLARDYQTHASIFFLKPLPTSGKGDLAWAPSAGQQLAHHLTARSPDLTVLSLQDVQIHVLGIAIIAQIVNSSWSALLNLCLRGCGLGVEGVTLLIQGNWPVLKGLHLSKNCLDAEAMSLLVKGDWPSLRKIDLGCNPTLDAVAIAHLSAAQWRLEVLVLAQVLVTPAMAAELAKLTTLVTIDLSDTGLIATAMRELARARTGQPCVPSASVAMT